MRGEEAAEQAEARPVSGFSKEPPEPDPPLQVWLRQTGLWAPAGLRAASPSTAASLLHVSQKHPFLSKPVSFKQNILVTFTYLGGGRLQELALSFQCGSWGSNWAASALIHQAILLALRFFSFLLDLSDVCGCACCALVCGGQRITWWGQLSPFAFMWAPDFELGLSGVASFFTC